MQGIQSWIVVRTKDGEPVMETYNPKSMELAARTPGLYVMTALDWLGAFNRATAINAAIAAQR